MNNKYWKKNRRPLSCRVDIEIYKRIQKEAKKKRLSIARAVEEIITNRFNQPE